MLTRCLTAPRDQLGYIMPQRMKKQGRYAGGCYRTWICSRSTRRLCTFSSMISTVNKLHLFCSPGSNGTAAPPAAAWLSVRLVSLIFQRAQGVKGAMLLLLLLLLQGALVAVVAQLANQCLTQTCVSQRDSATVAPRRQHLESRTRRNAAQQPSNNSRGSAAHGAVSTQETCYARTFL